MPGMMLQILLWSLAFSGRTASSLCNSPISKACLVLFFTKPSLWFEIKFFRRGSLLLTLSNIFPRFLSNLPPWLHQLWQLLFNKKSKFKSTLVCMNKKNLVIDLWWWLSLITFMLVGMGRNINKTKEFFSTSKLTPKALRWTATNLNCLCLFSFICCMENSKLKNWIKCSILLFCFVVWQTASLIKHLFPAVVHLWILKAHLLSSYLVVS